MPVCGGRGEGVCVCGGRGEGVCVCGGGGIVLYLFSNLFESESDNYSL